MNSSMPKFTRWAIGQTNIGDKDWHFDSNYLKIEIGSVYSTSSDPLSWDAMLLVGNRFTKIIEHSDTNYRGSANVVADGQFANLTSAVDAMIELDADETHSITADAASNAKFALVLFRSHNVPAPRLFPHDKELVVFKWEDTAIKKYAYIEDGILTFRIYQADGGDALTLDFEVGNFVQVGKAVGLLGGINKVDSSSR